MAGMYRHCFVYLWFCVVVVCAVVVEDNGDRKQEGDLRGDAELDADGMVVSQETHVAPVQIPDSEILHPTTMKDMVSFLMSTSASLPNSRGPTKHKFPDFRTRKSHTHSAKEHLIKRAEVADGSSDGGNNVNNDGDDGKEVASDRGNINKGDGGSTSQTESASVIQEGTQEITNGTESEDSVNITMKEINGSVSVENTTTTNLGEGNTKAEDTDWLVFTSTTTVAFTRKRNRPSFTEPRPSTDPGMHAEKLESEAKACNLMPVIFMWLPVVCHWIF